MHSGLVKRLGFGDEDNEDNEEILKPKKRKILRRKTNVEILSSDEGNDDDDAMDVDEIDNDDTAFSYHVNIQKILKIMNHSNLKELKMLNGIGAKKATEIQSMRPFDNVCICIFIKI